MSLATAAGDSDSFTAGEVGSVAFFPFGTARLGLRNRPPNLPALAFLPSPSVVSVSEVASGLFSRRLPRLLKKERRFSGPGGGGDAVADVPVGGEASVVSEMGAARAGSADGTGLGSSI